jgi:hypothetical protein
MSVTITLRIAADPERAEEIAAKDPNRMRTIRQDALEHGLIHHHFAGGDGEILVTDEWESVEGFKSFFNDNQLIPDLIKEIGVRGEPELKIWRRMEMYDDA